MGYFLKQSSTGRSLLFLMVDSGDHLTGKTGLSPTVTLSKNGGSFAAPSGAVTELSNGWYKVAGNATDANTLGPLLLHATASGADPCDDRFEVVAFDPDTTGSGGLPVVGGGANNFKSDASANVTVGGYAANQGPLYLLTGGGNTIAVNGSHNVSVASSQKVDLVDSPNANAISHIQSGLATAGGQTSILNAVNAVTTNTARSMPVVPSFLVRPSSGSTAYQVMLYLYNLQGILEDADSQAVTVHARTAAGSSRDANLGATTMTRVSAGKYTATYTVASAHAQEAVYFDFTWAIGGTSMADSGATQVQDAESLATLSAIKTQTDKLAFDESSNVKSSPQTAVTLTVDGCNALVGDVWSATTPHVDRAPGGIGFLDRRGRMERGRSGAVRDKRGQCAHRRDLAIRHLHDRFQERHGAALRPRLQRRGRHPPGRRIDDHVQRLPAGRPEPRRENGDRGPQRGIADGGRRDLRYAARRLAGERLQLQAHRPDQRPSGVHDCRAELSRGIHDHARRGRKNHPSISGTRTMSDADTIAAIKSQTLARIAEITAQPKPTYQINGQMIAWGGYLAQLQQTVDWCNEKLAGEAPFEVQSRGYT